MILNGVVIEKILKKAFQRGELHLEFSDDDIDYLLAHSLPTTSGRPSNDLLARLEQILLSASSARSAEPIAERASLEMAVKEKTMPFGRSTTAAGADAASLSAGDVLHEELRANGWTEKQAAEKLGLSERIMESLLAETTTVTKSTARRVAGLLTARYSLSGGAKELLGQWLLNGIQFRKLRRESGRTGSMRTAARPNRIGGQARKKKK